jgi:hypothetical protein
LHLFFWFFYLDEKNVEETLAENELLIKKPQIEGN